MGRVHTRWLRLHPNDRLLYRATFVGGGIVTLTCVAGAMAAPSGAFPIVLVGAGIISACIAIVSLALPIAESPSNLLCPRCGYDLRGSVARCPECGRLRPDGR